MEPKKMAANVTRAITMHHLMDSLECASSQVPTPRSRTASRMPAKASRIRSIAYAAAATRPITSTATSTRRPKREISGVTQKLVQALFRNVPQFLFVVLSIEDVPFSAAFGNSALLGFDLMPGGFVDFFFFFQPFQQDIDNSQTDRIAVFDEFDFVERGKLLGYLVGQEIYFFSAKSHPYSTTLRSRTSLFLISLNISWYEAPFWRI